MKINNVPIIDIETFLHTFFCGADIYSADIIDRDVDEFVVKFCLDNNMIEEVNDKGKRLYRILEAGKRVINK